MCGQCASRTCGAGAGAASEASGRKSTRSLPKYRSGVTPPGGSSVEYATWNQPLGYRGKGNRLMA